MLKLSEDCTKCTPSKIYYTNGGGGGGGGAHFACPCCTQFGYLQSHRYMPAHMHAIWYKQGFETAHLEELKGEDYVAKLHAPDIDN